MPARKQVTPAERERRRAVIAESVLRGTESQAKLAAKLGISQQRVSEEIRAIRAQWLADSAADFADHAAESLAARRDLLAEWWSGYAEIKSDPESAPKYLAGASNELARIERILGIGSDNVNLSGTLSTPQVILYLPSNNRDSTLNPDETVDHDPPAAGATGTIPSISG